MSDPTCFFTAQDDCLVPTSAARSPWSEQMLHGRLLSGLATRHVEAHHLEPAFRLSRLTVDMFKAPPMLPLRVTGSVARDGRRIRVADIEVHATDTLVGRASAVMVRTEPEAPGSGAWSPARSMPDPTSLAAPLGPRFAGMEIRSPDVAMRAVGQVRAWLRDTYTLVEGEPLSPLARVALASDLASPLANSGPEGLRFINADTTLYLHRHPIGDWIGFEVSEHDVTEGVSVSGCALFDCDGQIGTSSMVALANAPLG